jgi:adenylylsulfate kinase
MKLMVYWFYGRSGSGKTTLSEMLAERLRQSGVSVFLIDGDKLRSGLCRDLGFDEASRTENHRRAAELALLAAKQGLVVIGATMCPQSVHRALLRDVLGGDLRLIYLDADHEACARRDTKGLYRQFRAGKLDHFDRSAFVEPTTMEFDKRIHSGTGTIDECVGEVEAFVMGSFQS